MDPLIICTLITVVGGVIVEFIRRGNKKTDELKAQVVELTDRVEQLQRESIHWQSQYLLVLRQLSDQVNP